MRYLLLAGVALLSACGGDRAGTPGPVDSASNDAATAQPTNTAAPPANAALDKVTTPRQTGKYAPRDECDSLPGARAFRAALADAVAKRDADAIAAMALEDVRLGFGGDDGRARLIEKLKADGKLFDELAEIMPLGCAGSEGGGLVLPWSFAQDFGDVDSYRGMLVIGAGVPVLETPNAGGKVLRKLDWDVVELASGLEPDRPFQHVRLTDNSLGYIATPSLRSMLDYRLLAISQNGVWKISALLAGD